MSLSLLAVVATTSAAAPSPPAPMGPYKTKYATLHGGGDGWANKDDTIDVVYPTGTNETSVALRRAAQCAPLN